MLLESFWAGGMAILQLLSRICYSLNMLEFALVLSAVPRIICFYINMDFGFPKVPKVEKSHLLLKI